MPAGAQPGTATLTARVTAPGGPGGGQPGRGDHDGDVAYASLSAAYNNTGISDNSNEAAADYDGVGDSFSAQALAAGTPTALTPGTKVTDRRDDVHLAERGRGHPGQRGGRRADGRLSGSGTDLGFLGASQNGTATGTVTVHYTDGTSSSTSLNMADWYANAPAVGNQLLTTTSSWNFQSNSLGAHPVSLYFASVPLAKGKTVASVTLPTLENPGRHHGHAHLRHGHRVGHPERRAPRTRRWPPPSTTWASATTPTRPWPTSTAPGTASRPRRWRPARRPRSPRAARPPSAAPRSPGPRRAGPTT